MLHPSKERSPAFRVATLALAIASMGAFALIEVGVPYGYGTAGAYLYSGNFIGPEGAEWLLLVLPTSAAAALFVAATTLRNRKWHTRLSVLALVALGFAWVNLLGVRGATPFTFATSVPFLGMAGWLAVLLRGPDLPTRARDGPRGFEVLQPPGLTKPLVPPPPAAAPARRHFL